MTNTIDLPIHVDDALLLIGVLEHAIAEGQRNLDEWREGRVTYDNVAIDAAVTAIYRLQRWVEILRGNPMPLPEVPHAPR